MPEATHFRVATYVPNLIGYARFIFLMICPYWAFADNWWWTGIMYGMSYFLDFFDGKAARVYDQCSRFGAALDQICDRASNSICYMLLGIMFPKVSFIFFICFLLDFGSHWL